MDHPTGPQAAPVRSGNRTLQTTLVVVVLVVLLWLGYAWLNGQFPFAASSSENQTVDVKQAIEDATATGPSTLTGKEETAVLEQSTATGAGSLTAEQQAALIKESSAQ